MSTAGTWYAPAAGTGGFLAQLDSQVFSNPPFHHAMEHQDLASDQLQGAPDASAAPESREPASVVGELSEDQAIKGLADLMRGVSLHDGTFCGCTWEDLIQILITCALPRAILQSILCRPAPAPADGEVAELVAWLEAQAAKWRAVGRDAVESSLMAENFIRIADLLKQCQPARVAVAAEGEAGELVARLRRASDGASAMGWEGDSWMMARAADLLQHQPAPAPVAWMYRGEPDFDGKKWRDNWRVTLDQRLAEFEAKPDNPIPLFRAQRVPVPVAVSERPWEREGWCDEKGRCWWGRAADEFCSHDWHYSTRAEVEEYCSDAMPQVTLPHDALPLPTTEPQP